MLTDRVNIKEIDDFRADTAHGAAILNLTSQHPLDTFFLFNVFFIFEYRSTEERKSGWGGDVYILGIGMNKFGKYLNNGTKELVGESLEAVLKDASLSKNDIEAAWFGNSTWGIFSYQHCVRGPVALCVHILEK